MNKLSTEEKLANILRDAGYRVIAPDEEGSLDEELLGEHIQECFSEIDYLAFTETWEEAVERFILAGRDLRRWYQIRLK